MCEGDPLEYKRRVIQMDTRTLICIFDAVYHVVQEITSSLTDLGTLTHM